MNGPKAGVTACVLEMEGIGLENFERKGAKFKRGCYLATETLWNAIEYSFSSLGLEIVKKTPKESEIKKVSCSSNDTAFTCDLSGNFELCKLAIQEGMTRCQECLKMDTLQNKWNAIKRGSGEDAAWRDFLREQHLFCKDFTKSVEKVLFTEASK